MNRKLAQINVVCNGSTGKIMCDIAKKAESENIDTYCFFGRGKANTDINCIKIGNKISILFHAFLARLGFNGFGSYFSTKKLVKKLKKINPDVIHLHNIHGYYINLKVLFNYLKKEYTGRIVWTLHDCWAFTGHCSYFTMVHCEKWKQCCGKCPQLKAYPKEIFDTTKREYVNKKNLFLGLKNLTIVTPSKWLADLVKSSFLKEYEIKVINNGINLDIFKPTFDNSIYDKYKIPRDKKIILGVANIWEERKGLEDFIKLSQVISDDYLIVLVGKIPNKIVQKIQNNSKLILIERTDDQKELVALYSLSKVLFNPTREDNYPTINLEAQACGLPIVCYDTGGCPEQLFKENIVSKNCDINHVFELIKSDLKIKDNNADLNSFVNNYLEEYKK